MYQRQITKLALSKSVVKGGADLNFDGEFVEQKPSFTQSELRDLFKHREETIWYALVL